MIPWCVRWDVAYPISYRQLDGRARRRSRPCRLNRLLVKYLPLQHQQFRARKRSVGSSWRMDETYVNVEGRWKYLYRAVDMTGARWTSY